MAEQAHAQPTNASDPLYGWWLGMLPTLLGGLAASPADGANGAGRQAAPPSPVGQIMQALELTRQLLESVYGGYFRALIAQPAAEPLRAFGDLLRGRIAGIGGARSEAGSETLPGSVDFKALLPGPAGAAIASIAQAIGPLSMNVERTYGSLADAFGLAPLRELDAATREACAAALAQQRAQTEYLGVVRDAAGKGMQALAARLAEKARRGESVETMLALVRLWAAATDETMHEAMQSPRALQASADLVRARARLRRQRQRVVAIASDVLGVPARAEVDEAWREIQQLKRELRRMRKDAATVAAAREAPRAAKTSSQRTKSSRGTAVT